MCVSDPYVQSAHCQQEVQYILEQQYRVIAFIVKLSSDHTVQWIRTVLKDPICIDLTKFELSDAFETLKEAIIQERSQFKRDLNESSDTDDFLKANFPPYVLYF